MGEIAEMMIGQEMFGTRHRAGQRVYNYRSGIKKYLLKIGIEYSKHYGLLLQFSRDVLKLSVSHNTSKDTLSLNASQNFNQFITWIKKEEGGK